MARTLGLQHIIQRKRSLFRRVVDWFKTGHDIDDIMIFIAVVYPLTVIPQILKIMELQDASAISVTSFTLKAFLAIPWMLYGIKHKSKPILISNALWFVGYSAIIAQTFVY